MTKISTNISEEHRRAFDALTGGEAGNFVLCSCFVSGEPAAAIAAVTLCPPSQELGAPDYRITPLFVSVTPGMTLVDHDGRERHEPQNRLTLCGRAFTPGHAGSTGERETENVNH